MRLAVVLVALVLALAPEAARALQLRLTERTLTLDDDAVEAKPVHVRPAYTQPPAQAAKGGVSPGWVMLEFFGGLGAELLVMYTAALPIIEIGAIVSESTSSSLSIGSAASMAVLASALGAFGSSGAVAGLARASREHPRYWHVVSYSVLVRAAALAAGLAISAGRNDFTPLLAMYVVGSVGGTIAEVVAANDGSADEVPPPPIPPVASVVPREPMPRNTVSMNLLAFAF